MSRHPDNKDSIRTGDGGTVFTRRYFYL